MASGGPWGWESPEDCALNPRLPQAPSEGCRRFRRKDAAELLGFRSASAISHCGGF